MRFERTISLVGFLVVFFVFLLLFLIARTHCTGLLLVVHFNWKCAKTHDFLPQGKNLGFA